MRERQHPQAATTAAEYSTSASSPRKVSFSSTDLTVKPLQLRAPPAAVSVSAGAGAAPPSSRRAQAAASLSPRDPNIQSAEAPAPKTANMSNKDDISLQSRQPHQRQLPPQLPPLSTNASFSSSLGFGDLSSSSPGTGEKAKTTKVGLPDLDMVPTERQHKAPVPKRQHEPSPIVTVDDSRSVCQSPSWEAYDRRKKEKKSSKEKERADKAPKPRKRRLSKEPPSSVPPSPSFQSSGAQTSRPSLNLSRDPSPSPRFLQDRSTSAFELHSPVFPDDGTSSRPRSRAGSFTSLIKAPFEIRRPSFDRSTEPGFIGGIKLEQHRLLAHQAALTGQSPFTEADIHPAFRKRERRSSSPLRFPAIGARAEAKDPQKRAYPPISIKTSSAKNQALIAAESCSDSEDTMMKKFRARVGFGTGKAANLQETKTTRTPENKRAGRRLSKLPAPPRDEAISKIMSGPNVSTPAVGSSWAPPSSSPLAQKEDAITATGLGIDPSSNPGLDSLPPFAPRTLVVDAMVATEGHSLAAPTSPPPEPPRKSSKRKSIVNMAELGGPLPDSEHQAMAAKVSPSLSSEGSPKTGSTPKKTQRTRRESFTDPPSIAYDALASGAGSGNPAGHSRRTFREAARAAFGLDHSGQTPGAKRDASQSRPPQAHLRHQSTMPAKSGPGNNEPDWKDVQAVPSSPPINSSEDSCSDDMQSPSSPGTPDTSRPVSAAFPPPVVPETHHTQDKLKVEDQHIRHISVQSSMAPSPAFSHSDSTQSHNKPSSIDLDPIQAAAMKVMAAFPDAAPRRLDADRRSTSDTNLPRNIFLPKGKQPASPLRDRSRPAPVRTSLGGVKDDSAKSPPLRDLIMSKDESSVAAPWPATYLEAARRAAPSKASKAVVHQPSVAAAPAQLPPSDFGANEDGENKGIAKMFVECCACKYYHDMPSKLYEAMANPDAVISPSDSQDFAGTLSMTVKCPWCKHEMSTKCCAGLAAMVYVKERLH
jgi:hypothetical protein